MLVRDTRDNMYHIIAFETKKKRVRTFHALCGKSFTRVPHGFESADYYTRCDDCKRLMLKRVGKPVEKQLEMQAVDDG